MNNIFDCSNSKERPAHRGGGGPVMNDIMRYLHENAVKYDYKFVSSVDEADVIITNDVFTKEALFSSKPLVKRACGPFWQKEHADRNEQLNAAMRQADAVIFITEYSKKQYLHCYGDDLNCSCVITHWVDPANFYNCRYTPFYNKFVFVACATNWSRKEKRLSTIIDFADQIKNECDVVFIGTINDKVSLPSNINLMGYCDSQTINTILNMSNGFLNFSYRDAATKTVCQAISCELPVLYTDSGGVSEMVGEYGIAIRDPHTFDIEDSIPELKMEDIFSAYDLYVKKFKDIKSSLLNFDSQKKFENMLDGYFNVIDNVLHGRIK